MTNLKSPLNSYRGHVSRRIHGDSLIEDAEFGEEIIDFEGVGPEFGLDALNAGSSDGVDDCVANHTHRISGASGADAAMVFSHDRVLDPEQAILDRPPRTPQPQKPVGSRRFHGVAGDRIRHRSLRFAFDNRRAFELQELPHARPIAGVGSDRRGGERATFEAAATLLPSARRPPFFTRLAFSQGGEKPSGITKAWTA